MFTPEKKRCIKKRRSFKSLQPGLAALSTFQLAKRQLTWLRAMPQRQVVVADAPDALLQVLTLASRYATQRP